MDADAPMPDALSQRPSDSRLAGIEEAVFAVAVIADRRVNAGR